MADTAKEIFDRVWRAFTLRKPGVRDLDASKKAAEMVKLRRGNEARVAEELGVKKRTVRDWIRGKTKPSKANAAKIDTATNDIIVERRMRTAKNSVQETDSPAGIETRRGGLTIRALVVIGQDRPRDRVFHLGKEVGAARINALAAALKTGDNEEVKKILEQMIAVYIGQPEDYEVDIKRLDEITLTALR